MSNGQPEEFWADIPGYEGLYQVSNLGRIKSLAKTIVKTDGVIQNRKERIVKQSPSRGYKVFTFRKDGEIKTLRVHRVVAEVFLHKPSEDMVVNHKDGNKSNNIYTNLEWVTQRENVRHALETGCMDHMKLAVVCSKTNGDFVREFESIAEATKWLRENVNPKARKSSISACCKNKKHYNTAYGFKWYLK